MSVEPSEGMESVRVFAPASIGNLGPGFDVLGMAIEELGDTVEARRIDRKTVRILQIEGGDGKLPLEAASNTAGIAAAEVLRALRAPGGVELRIQKGIPGSGLGSSAASAVAGALATNHLFGAKLSKAELIPACAKAERKVSGGRFLDNIGASLMGGVVVTHPAEGTVVPVGTIPDAVIVVVTPVLRLLTRRARKVIPVKVKLDLAISNLSFSCRIVAAVAAQDVPMFGTSIRDLLIEPFRAGLIPGFSAVKRAAMKNGALGCSISGAGASVFAVTDSAEKAGRIGEAMRKGFLRAGLKSTVTTTGMDPIGARVLS